MAEDNLCAEVHSLPIETQVHLLRQTVNTQDKSIEKLSDKVGNLEKSEVVTQQQLKVVFSNLDEIKSGQTEILNKLEEKDKEDKEALKSTIKQNRDLKILVVTTVITTIVTLASVIIPLFINK